MVRTDVFLFPFPLLCEMAESEEGLLSSLQALSEAMGRWDLKGNGKKTKVMKTK